MRQLKPLLEQGRSRRLVLVMASSCAPAAVVQQSQSELWLSILANSHNQVLMREAKAAMWQTHTNFIAQSYGVLLVGCTARPLD